MGTVTQPLISLLQPAQKTAEVSKYPKPNSNALFSCRVSYYWPNHMSSMTSKLGDAVSSHIVPSKPELVIW